MRGLHLFVFLALLPALLALGHDVYLFTQNNELNEISNIAQDQDTNVQSFFADLGFIWTSYAPESYAKAAKALGPENWPMVSKVLTRKAVLVGLVFAGFNFIVLFVLKIFGINIFRETNAVNTGRNKRVYEILGKTSKEIKYKRK